MRLNTPCAHSLSCLRSRTFAAFRSGPQLQAARTLTGFSQAHLARRAGVSVITLRRMESAREGPIACRRYSINAVRRALEDAGVLFNEDGWPVA